MVSFLDSHSVKSICIELINTNNSYSEKLKIVHTVWLKIVHTVWLKIVHTVWLKIRTC